MDARRYNEYTFPSIGTHAGNAIRLSVYNITPRGTWNYKADKPMIATVRLYSPEGLKVYITHQTNSFLLSDINKQSFGYFNEII